MFTELDISSLLQGVLNLFAGSVDSSETNLADRILSSEVRSKYIRCTLMRGRVYCQRLVDKKWVEVK